MQHRPRSESFDAKSPVLTRRDLKDAASGNITIEEILNRARYDDTFNSSKFAALIEDPDKPPLCYFYTWEDGVCRYGDKCRYVHDVDLILRSLGDAFVCQKGPLVRLTRRPLQWLTGPKSTVKPHRVAYLEFQGKVVWFRDGGKKSSDLWSKCQTKIASRQSQLRAIASMDTFSQPSVPECVQQLELLIEESFDSLFAFLDVVDIRNLLISFVGTKYVREDHRTCVLSPAVWESAIAAKWRLRTLVEDPIQTFLALERATAEAHAVLVSSSLGLFTHANSGGFDPHPASGVPALRELRPNATPGKTILVTEDESPVADIRFTDALMALSNGQELSVFRTGDLVKISSCRQKAACDRVTVPLTRDGNIVVHAGPAGVFWRDLDESTMPVIGKVTSTPELRCKSLDASRNSIFAGYTCGLSRVNTETCSVISELQMTGLVNSRMWSEDGKLHMIVTQNGALSRCDWRLKDQIELVNTGAVPMNIATSGWGAHIVAVGSQRSCMLFDLRNPTAPIWDFATDIPVTNIALTQRTISLFQSSQAQLTSTVRAFDYTCGSPMLIGEHVLPFRVSAVGHSSGGAQKGIGCIYAVERPKRSGRGDNGILCIGGQGFLAPPPRSSPPVTSRGSIIHTRRQSRDLR